MPDRIPTRTLGPDGPVVGAVGLGCMGMSWAYGTADNDDAAGEALIRHALELGVTLLDTSDVYGPFHNESLVGRALDGVDRDAFVLATKGGLVGRRDERDRPVIERDGHPDHLRVAIDASLGRLGLDVIDLYYLHRVDPGVPVEESWGVLAEAVQAGKLRRLGISEATTDELDRVHAVHPVAALQSELSLWTRDPLENGAFAWCTEHGAAFVPFSPLGRGFLTGSITEATFADDDMRNTNPRFAPSALDANQAIVDRVREIAAGHDATPGQVALAWTLAQGEHVVPIPGTRRTAYLEENAAAAALSLTADDLAALDALPPAQGERYTA